MDGYLCGTIGWYGSSQPGPLALLYVSHLLIWVLGHIGRQSGLQRRALCYGHGAAPLSGLKLGVRPFFNFAIFPSMRSTFRIGV